MTPRDRWLHANFWRLRNLRTNTLNFMYRHRVKR